MLGKIIVQHEMIAGIETINEGSTTRWMTWVGDMEEEGMNGGDG